MTDATRLAELADTLHRGNGCIVLTNGCFDVLHRGHVETLREARALGDVLVVALNTDDSVRLRKGPTRPLNALADRVAVLEALRAVDHVVAFDAPDAVPVVEALRPHVYVKGADYAGEDLPEARAVARYGGRVHLARMVEGLSTSALLARTSEAAPPRH